MKKLITSCLAFIIILSYSMKAARPTEINNSRPAKQQVRDFHGVASGGSIDVVIRLGNSESIRFEGDQEAISELVTEKEDGVLVIRPSSKKWWDWEKRFKNSRVTAYITAKKLDKLMMAGSGNMTVNGTLSGPSLAAVLSGSGKIQVTANISGKMESAISGSGSVNLQGKANYAEVAISGSGSLNGRSFQVNDLQAAISGSGNISMSVGKRLDAAISGSGNIRYAGSPSVQKRVAGSGNVTRL
ncbi:DUF2807 domain-containing protein [Pedobacter yulinensis]|uniref:DUF2807 domain-containing protein n=1 Tax=Pedobacter yulinensis TaxID=2126353 RepID=A0A2T3HPK2_9SPHI|nr:head GIN domain-containing protein [Pedobacter yulinensis]PST84372.1 DUF2807 domain-containing protein [Pedobacter yulinensis]